MLGCFPFHSLNLIGETMDISNLSAADLRALQESIKQELKKRETQEISNARNQIIAIAQSVGVSLKDLMGSGSVRAKSGPVAVQYRNPDNAVEQWTGRGRQPKWVKAALEAGKTLDALRVSQ
jgi:DNA-binding protein H-NS